MTESSNIPAGERDIFKEIVDVRGFKTLPTFYQAMKPYPRLTAQFWDSLKAAVQGGVIDAKTKEMIALGVCITLGARYCIDSHIAMAKDVGVTEAEIEEIMMIVAAFSQTANICSALNPLFNPSEYQKDGTTA